MVPRAYSIRVRDFQLNFAPSVDDGENFHWRKKGYSRVSLKTQGSTFPWIWRCGKFPFNRMIHMPWNFSSLSSSPSFFRPKLTPTFVRLCCFQHIHRANVSCYIFYDDRKTMNDIFLVKMFVYSIFFFSRSNTKWDWMLISYEEMLVSIDLTVNLLLSQDDLARCTKVLASLSCTLIGAGLKSDNRFASSQLLFGEFTTILSCWWWATVRSLELRMLVALYNKIQTRL